MTDPQRLLDPDSGSTAAERLLLRKAEACPVPTAAQAAAVRHALEARFPVEMNAGSAPGASGAAWGAAAKSALAAALAVVVIAAGFVRMRAHGGLPTSAPPGPAPASTPANVVSVAMASASSDAVLVPEASARAGRAIGPATPSVDPAPPSPGVPVVHGPPAAKAATTAPGVHRDPSPGPPVPVAAPQPPAAVAVSAAPAVAPTPVSTLREESRSLEYVRDAVAHGSLEEARARLQLHSARFPDGHLEQERRALEVEVLRLGGDRAALKASIRSFLRDYPASPHAAALREHLSDE